MEDKILFTPAAVLDFLSQVEELSDKDISLAEGPDTVQIAIGENLYNIETNNAAEVEVEDEVLEQVEEAAEEGYDSINEEVTTEEVEDVPAVLDEVESSEKIEGGILGELAKTLFIGGLVRLQNKFMSKEQFEAYAQQAQKLRGGR